MLMFLKADWSDNDADRDDLCCKSLGAMGNMLDLFEIFQEGCFMQVKI